MIGDGLPHDAFEWLIYSEDSEAASSRAGLRRVKGAGAYSLLASTSRAFADLSALGSPPPLEYEKPSADGRNLIYYYPLKPFVLRSRHCLVALIGFLSGADPFEHLGLKSPDFPKGTVGTLTTCHTMRTESPQPACLCT